MDSPDFDKRVDFDAIVEPLMQKLYEACHQAGVTGVVLIDVVHEGSHSETRGMTLNPMAKASSSVALAMRSCQNAVLAEVLVGTMEYFDKQLH